VQDFGKGAELQMKLGPNSTNDLNGLLFWLVQKCDVRDSGTASRIGARRFHRWYALLLPPTMAVSPSETQSPKTG
jgi:hypothetical protein